MDGIILGDLKIGKNWQKLRIWENILILVKKYTKTKNIYNYFFQLKLDYLHKLWIVIRDSTVCLMFHERRQTLSMVRHQRANKN
jgi:hypothetical protein